MKVAVGFALDSTTTRGSESATRPSIVRGHRHRRGDEPVVGQSHGYRSGGDTHSCYHRIGSPGCSKSRWCFHLLTRAEHVDLRRRVPDWPSAVGHRDADCVDVRPACRYGWGLRPSPCPVTEIPGIVQPAA